MNKKVFSLIISDGILTRKGRLNMATVKKLGWTVASKSSDQETLGTGLNLQ